MPLQTYADTRPYAAAIHEATARKLMPPWFADPCCGHFANDPTLSPKELATLAAWAEDHAPQGDPHDAPPAPFFAEGWNIPPPDVVLRMPAPKQIPASGDIPYQYIIIPTGFKQDRWVRISEIRPSNRIVVHHAVAYIREPGSKWLKGAPVGTAFSADDLADPALRRDAMWTSSDILLVYAPGSSPDQWPQKYLEARACWIRYRPADALHNARRPYAGPNKRRTRIRQTLTREAGSYTTAHKRPIRHPARRS